MASEDSDELRSGFSSVHRLYDLRNLHQTLSGQVVTAGDQLHAVGELPEILSLCCMERMLLEERNDPLQQILATTDDVAMQVFSVVVCPPIHVHLSYAEELAEFVETLDATRALRHYEIMRDLVSGLVAFTARAVWLPHEAD